ncbi:type III ribulose-bisphosphate carboxylase [Candidatus Woesearchaeota archaeon]|nr:type III ribulose-bisphosphate carboxylase [Candidatus Woesearchaeota archaeon]
MPEEKIEWYHEFINTNYKPKNDDVKALFYYEPAENITPEDAIGRVASESSSGTWTTLTETPKLLPKVKAYAYRYDSNYVRIAYPRILFENSSVPGMMSGIGGNIYGMKAVKNLRLIDVELPLDYIKDFKGPNYGSDVIKRIFKRKSGPVTSVVPKPKLGYTAEEHAKKVGYAVWKGGIDCVKDDENLTSQTFNKFEERVKLLAKYRDKAMKETGQIKDAFINVTAPDLKELEKRVKLVHDNGFRYFMIDMVVSGFTAVGTAVQLAYDYDMAIHGHRAMHAMFTRNPKHGMTMLFFAKLMRLIGVDQIHTGTGVGKLEGSAESIMAMEKMLMQQEINEIENVRLHQKWGKIKPVLPVSSGGLHPGILPAVFDIYGTMDIGLQVGGGTQGHPDGIEAGARAVMQAIEAYKQKTSLKEYAENHKELRRALEKWGSLKPI